MDLPPAAWWAGVDPDWDCHSALAHQESRCLIAEGAEGGTYPELDLGDGRVPVLDAGEPFPPDGFDAFPGD